MKALPISIQGQTRLDSHSPSGLSPQDVHSSSLCQTLAAHSGWNAHPSSQSLFSSSSPVRPLPGKVRRVAQDGIYPVEAAGQVASYPTQSVDRAANPENMAPWLVEACECFKSEVKKKLESIEELLPILSASELDSDKQSAALKQLFASAMELVLAGTEWAKHRSSWPNAARIPDADHLVRSGSLLMKEGNLLCALQALAEAMLQDPTHWKGLGMLAECSRKLAANAHSQEELSCARPTFMRDLNEAVSQMLESHNGALPNHRSNLSSLESWRSGSIKLVASCERWRNLLRMVRPACPYLPLEGWLVPANQAMCAGRLAEAIKLYSKVLEHQPMHIEALEGLILAGMQSKERVDVMITQRYFSARDARIDQWLKNAR